MTAPEPLPGPAWLRQQWLDVVFAHWRVEAAQVAAILPAGVRPDTFDGDSYVGLVAFRLRGCGLVHGPALLPEFVETNVRVYGVDGAGRAGVVFASLDVGSATMAATGRLVGLPYRWARAGHRDDGAHHYATLLPRHGTPTLRSRIAVEPGERITPDPLTQFLTARWGLHLRRFGQTWYLRNTHEPWPLQAATVVDLVDELVPAAGFASVAGRPPDHLAYSPGVRTVFGRPALA